MLFACVLPYCILTCHFTQCEMFHILFRQAWLHFLLSRWCWRYHWVSGQSEIELFCLRTITLWNLRKNRRICIVDLFYRKMKNLLTNHDEQKRNIETKKEKIHKKAYFCFFCPNPIVYIITVKLPIFQWSLMTLTYIDMILTNTLFFRTVIFLLTFINHNNDLFIYNSINIFLD